MNDSSKNIIIVPVSEDAQTRLLLHGMHEETIFYNRMNFSMLIEALLFTSLLSANGLKPENGRVAQICGWVGLLVAVFWWLVQFDKRRMLDTLVKRIEDDVPDVAKTWELNKERYRFEVEATNMLVWFPPLLCGAASIALLVITYMR